MAIDIPGLLSGLAGLPGAINQSLLGPMPVDPRLEQRMGPQVQQARQQALNNMAMGMLAGDIRGPGHTLARATGGAQERFQGRIFDLMKQGEYERFMQTREAEGLQQAQLAAALQGVTKPEKLPMSDEAWAALPPKDKITLYGQYTPQRSKYVSGDIRRIDDKNYRITQEMQEDGSWAEIGRQYIGPSASSGSGGSGGTGPRPTQTQAKAGQFASRMEQLGGDVRNEVPSFKNFGAYSASLNTGGALQGVANSMISDEWLPHFNATRGWLAGVLRQDTGAAITAEEYRQYYPTYFPMPGDTPEVIKQKRLLRENETRRMMQIAEGVPNVGVTREAAPTRATDLASEAQKELERRGLSRGVTGSF